MVVSKTLVGYFKGFLAALFIVVLYGATMLLPDLLMSLVL